MATGDPKPFRLIFGDVHASLAGEHGKKNRCVDYGR